MTLWRNLSEHRTELDLQNAKTVSDIFRTEEYMSWLGILFVDNRLAQGQAENVRIYTAECIRLDKCQDQIQQWL